MRVNMASLRYPLKEQNAYHSVSRPAHAHPAAEHRCAREIPWRRREFPPRRGRRDVATSGGSPRGAGKFSTACGNFRADCGVNSGLMEEFVAVRLLKKGLAGDYRQ